jgi:hypothetical protein
MKPMKTLVSTIFILCLPFLADAQFGGLLDKAKKKVNDKVNEKVNKAEDKIIDKATNSSTNSNSGTTPSNGTSSSNNTTTSNKSEQPVSNAAKGYNCDDLRGKSMNILYLHFELKSNGNKSFGFYDAERFLKEAKELDYINLKPFLNSSTECTNKSDKETLKAFEAKFLADFKARGIGAFNHFIDQAYIYSKSKFDVEKRYAIEWIDAAVLQMQGVKLILPDVKEVLEMEAEVLKAEKNIKGDKAKKEAAVSKSAMHLKYMDKIMFSNKPIVVGQENEADFKTSFKPGEKIYAVAYLKAGIKDLSGSAKEDQTIYATTWADGSGLFGQSFEYANDNRVGRKLTKAEVDQNMAVWTFELVADEKTATSPIPWYFADMIKNLSPRKHAIQLLMGEWNKGGSFEIDLDGIDLEKNVADAQAYSIKAAEMIANNRTIPDEWKKYTKKSFNDPALNMGAMKSLLKQDYSDIVEVLRVVVLANTDYEEWTLEKSELDIPKFKYSPAVGVVYKSKDGKCYFMTADFRKIYEGGGRYTSPKVNWLNVDKVMIGCANVNK